MSDIGVEINTRVNSIQNVGMQINLANLRHQY